MFELFWYKVFVHWKFELLNFPKDFILICLFFIQSVVVITEEMDEDESNGYVDISNDNSDVMGMKMALMAARRAEVTKYAEGKPSI